MSTTTRRSRRLALVLAGLLSLSVGTAGAALADIGDFQACPGPDLDGVQHDCDGVPDDDPEIDDEAVPDPDPEDPDVDSDDAELPPAPTGDVVVADANFTG